MREEGREEDVGLRCGGAGPRAVARLSWSVPQFHRMVDSGVGSEQRSAVHRAMYQGVRLRMLREIKAPKASKKLKAE